MEGHVDEDKDVGEPTALALGDVAEIVHPEEIVVVEEITEGGDDDDEAIPEPTPYDCGNGNMLAYTYTTSGDKVSRQVVYHSTSVKPTDDEALLMCFECGYTERECKVSYVGVNETVRGSFVEHFILGEVLRPIRNNVVRLCVCPKHKQLSMAHPLMDALMSCTALLPPKQGDVSDECGWRVVVEDGDSFVRFFDVQRSKSCYCEFPVLFLP